MFGTGPSAVRHVCGTARRIQQLQKLAESLATVQRLSKVATPSSIGYGANDDE